MEQQTSQSLLSSVLFTSFIHQQVLVQKKQTSSESAFHHDHHDNVDHDDVDDDDHDHDHDDARSKRKGHKKGLSQSKSFVKSLSSFKEFISFNRRQLLKTILLLVWLLIPIMAIFFLLTQFYSKKE
eukprot:TRINITY_DN176_c0_g7_i2.p1 TRINITY_DN176_c0_g7~~TRINITY_DN176_c0_g7_i2.p1  ORF type:complete len:126 (-),score=31.68 TRINITY_DN176_c0_g7_i2:37-414(-)